jgi:acyl carrier protein
MPSKTTLMRVIDLVADAFVIDPCLLAATSTADDVPGWDSVSQVMLIMRIEDDFCIQLDSADVNKAVSLQALADVIDRCPVGPSAS